MYVKYNNLEDKEELIVIEVPEAQGNALIATGVWDRSTKELYEDPKNDSRMWR